MKVVHRSLINLVLRECHDSSFSGHLSGDRTREKIKTCIWWPMWQKDVAEYCKTCDRCQKANKSTTKRLGNMIKTQKPSRPCEIFHMDWVTGLPPGGDRMTEIPDSPQHCGQIFTNYLGQSYPSFSTACHLQTDGLAKRMIQALEDMVRRFCAYDLEFKHCDGFTHYWCTLLPALELAYKTSIHASTNQTPSILEKRMESQITSGFAEERFR
ncbi:hypothetical protein O181_042039 [Austropuccinia psidii MF-1]|uniref:Integrase zinc-binding domain-containing protein n=1 Tax=Austropuccinia psidii MF-1 TaxID=1389203 RepID=A0A9Q3DFB1_9BASI|nr:hypothetical protein [Austropuccinia psidii MF-1]